MSSAGCLTWRAGVCTRQWYGRRHQPQPLWWALPQRRLHPQAIAPCMHHNRLYKCYTRKPGSLPSRYSKDAHQHQWSSTQVFMQDLQKGWKTGSCSCCKANLHCTARCHVITGLSIESVFTGTGRISGQSVVSCTALAFLSTVELMCYTKVWLCSWLAKAPILPFWSHE